MKPPIKHRIKTAIPDANICGPGSQDVNRANLGIPDHVPVWETTDGLVQSFKMCIFK